VQRKLSDLIPLPLSLFRCPYPFSAPPRTPACLKQRSLTDVEGEFQVRAIYFPNDAILDSQQ